MKLAFGATPMVFVLAGAVWILAGGEKGTHFEATDGQRRVSLSNANLLALLLLARGALGALSRAPVPLPVGIVIDGSPADPKNLVEGPADLPAGVRVAEKSVDVPSGAGQLR
jgi:hypothetical protein